MRDRADWARDHGLNFLASLTAVHYVDDEEMHVVAHVYRIDPGGGMGERLPSASSIWPAASWHEREVYDMFGIRSKAIPTCGAS